MKIPHQDAICRGGSYIQLACGMLNCKMTKLSPTDCLLQGHPVQVRLTFMSSSNFVGLILVAIVKHFCLLTV